MAAGFDWLAQAGVQNVEAQAAHKRQLQDEQRQSKEAALQSQLNSGAITAGQYGQGLNDLYAHEPAESRLGRIGRGLERAVGLKKQAAAQKAQADAKLAAKPSPRRDFAQIEAGAKSPEQLAGEAATAKTEAEIQGVQSTWQAFQRMAKDLPPDQRSQLEALFGFAARPTLKEYVSPDGSQRQWFDANTPAMIPPGWQATAGTAIKPIKGTLVRSAQSPTGFAQTYLDPMNPNKIVAWQPITPSRYYQGTVTAGSTTDPFGVTTSSTRTTQPLNQSTVDLSGIMALPPEEGQPAAPTPAPSGAPAPRATPSATGRPQAAFPGAGFPAPRGAAPALDANGHIPAGAGNPFLVSAANQLLDGMDVNKMPLPQRDREAAAHLASEYGWQQGLFTPREKLQLKEGATFLNQMANSPDLAVLDSGFFGKLPMASQSTDPSKAGFWERITTSMGAQAQTPQQAAFMRQYRQLVQTVSGLRQLVQSGRATEAQVDRLIAELPNPYNTTSADDARQRIKLLQQELQIAYQTGKLPDAAPTDDPAVDKFLKSF